MANAIICINDQTKEFVMSQYIVRCYSLNYGTAGNKTYITLRGSEGCSVETPLSVEEIRTRIKCSFGGV